MIGLVPANDAHSDHVRRPVEIILNSRLTPSRQHPGRRETQAPGGAAGRPLDPVAERSPQLNDLSPYPDELVHTSVDRHGPLPGRPVVLALRTQEDRRVGREGVGEERLNERGDDPPPPGVVGPSAIISSVSDVEGDKAAKPEFGDGTLVSDQM